MISMVTRRLHLALKLALGFAAVVAVHAEPVTRVEALAIAQTYIGHRWEALPESVRHGRDRAGIEIHTPDRPGGRADPDADGWTPGTVNTGVPYKWGGFDTPARFDAGIRAGQAAGDVYTLEKRRQGEAAVSSDAVGIDCSGFVSRCWKLSAKHSTGMLFGICRRLRIATELQPADVMNTGGGHVLLFAHWLDDEKTRARFYEAAPFSKTRVTERSLAELTAAGYVPLRYRGIR